MNVRRVVSVCVVLLICAPALTLAQGIVVGGRVSDVQGAVWPTCG